MKGRCKLKIIGNGAGVYHRKCSDAGSSELLVDCDYELYQTVNRKTAYPIDKVNLKSNLMSSTVEVTGLVLKQNI